ncbi:MAG: hypothetical protein ACM336_18510 [Acidobacteriota bacterium]
MWHRMRAIVTLAAFLVGLTLVVGLGSGWADAWIVAAAWGLFAVLSALKVWSMWRSRANPEEHEAKLTLSQTGVLPHSWQRWIAGEPRERPKPLK